MIWKLVAHFGNVRDVTPIFLLVSVFYILIRHNVAEALVQRLEQLIDVITEQRSSFMIADPSETFVGCFDSPLYLFVILFVGFQ